jgi:hypothetical protein
MIGFGGLVIVLSFSDRFVPAIPTQVRCRCCDTIDAMGFPGFQCPFWNPRDVAAPDGRVDSMALLPDNAIVEVSRRRKGPMPE